MLGCKAAVSQNVTVWRKIMKWENGYLALVLLYFECFVLYQLWDYLFRFTSYSIITSPVNLLVNYFFTKGMTLYPTRFVLGIWRSNPNSKIVFKCENLGWPGVFTDQFLKIFMNKSKILVNLWMVKASTWKVV